MKYYCNLKIQFDTQIVLANIISAEISSAPYYFCGNCDVYIYIYLFTVTLDQIDKSKQYKYINVLLKKKKNVIYVHNVIEK